MRDEDILKTTFTILWDTYTYLQMLFGLCKARGTFPKVQTKVFEPFIGRFITVYLDNFAIYGSKNDLVLHVQLAFQRLPNFCYSLSLEKCHLGFKKGALLDQVIFEGGIKDDPGKVQKNLDLKKLISPSNVAILMRMATYYYQFISNLVEKVKLVTV